MKALSSLARLAAGLLRDVRRMLPLAAGAMLALAATGVPAQIIKFPPPGGFEIILPNPEDFYAITAGSNHTCAVKNNGNVYCWGLNTVGQVGTSSTATCTGVACVNRPRYVMNARTVDAGHDHTCALDGSGLAHCWGNSNYGQLGNGNYGYQTQPIPVSGGRVFTMISAGQYSTCGTTSAGVFCWGVIMNGWSGVPLPQQVFAFNGYDSVSVGYNHACALYRVGGYGFTDCWGNNRYGQLGIDPTWLQNAPPTVGTSFSPYGNRQAAQSYYTCVDQSNTTVQCAGYNGWGQLGSGNYTTTHQPQNVGGGMALYGVSTGPNHACALDPTGRAHCWGNGYWGQLGNGVSAVYPSPQPVSGGRSYRAIAAGDRHTCAIGTDNQIYCWGSNYYGQLGTMYPGGWVSTPVQALNP